MKKWDSRFHKAETINELAISINMTKPTDNLI